MKPLDDELRSLFKRKEPPEGFARRVLDRIETALPQLTLTQRFSMLFHRSAVRWVAVAAACALVALGVVRYQHQQQVSAKAEQASREAMLALEITNTELDAALERAQRVTVQALKVRTKSKSEME